MFDVKALGLRHVWLHGHARPLPQTHVVRVEKRSVRRLRTLPAARCAAEDAFAQNGDSAALNPDPKFVPLTSEDEELAELHKIISLLPKNLQETLQSHSDLRNLLEVVIDLGRVPFARFPEGDLELGEDPASQKDISFAVAQVGKFGGDNRAGICGTLHRISCIRNRKSQIIGLTARVGRHVSGSAQLVADIIKEGISILLLGYPGRGKTTAIRSMCKILADEEKKRVVIVDTSNEIAGDGDIPHKSIGRARRMHVAHPHNQHEVMIEAVENHMPQVIVIDEIGTDMECKAALTISQRGVQLIATAHGTRLENLVKNPQLQDLIGGVDSVTLGDKTARERGVQKTVLERVTSPAFDVAIEMVERDVWIVHHDLAAAVDKILAGKKVFGEKRTRSESGEIIIGSPRQTLQEHPLKTIQSPTAIPFIEEEPVMASLDRAGNARNSDKQLSEHDLMAYQQDDDFLEDGDTNWDFFNEAESAAKKTRKSVTLRLFLIGVEQQQLHEILEVMGLKGRVAVTTYLKKAHAVLGTQTELRRGEWVEKSARLAGVPLFSLNSKSNMAVAKAIQSLLGLTPSTPSSLPDHAFSTDTQTETAPQVASDEENKSSREVTSALDEVRYAIEDIIVPRKQPVELMPQVPFILQMQEDMIGSYDLPYETVGEGNRTRLRIYPSKAEMVEESKSENA